MARGCDVAGTDFEIVDRDEGMVCTQTQIRAALAALGVPVGRMREIGRIEITSHCVHVTYIAVGGMQPAVWPGSDEVATFLSCMPVDWNA